ncbi:MAG: methyltransferase [Bifidobacterium crudilactis]|uniref:Methyltransferase n=1 Tax=Bifidobacterium crudilactis TaxID=327277 RepID=A0A971CZX5_9BIFI|nr:methyltransferase [Bifidobacterium crudilactis]
MRLRARDDGGRHVATGREPRERRQKDKKQVSAQDQYFSANPQSEDIRRTLHITLRGHEVQATVSNGVFSSGRLDLGTSVLLRHAPQPPETGTFLDLGCGWGPIALTLSLESPKASIHAIDINERAVSLTAENASNLGLPNITASTADNLPESLGFDLIWSNPPIRIGKEALHTLLMTYLHRLNPAGRAYLVVQKNLGADSLITWLSGTLNTPSGNSQEESGDGVGHPTEEEAATPTWSVGKIASSKGFRVIEVIRPMLSDEASEHGSKGVHDAEPRTAETHTPEPHNAEPHNSTADTAQD